jgi:D-threo-aldose 1-dehydrogenase
MDPTARRQLGRTGLALTQLGMGTAPLGDLWERIPEERAQATFAAAWQQGVRYFDTAPWYGNTLAEQRLGHFLRQQPRADFAISTKVGRVYTRPQDPDRFDPAGFWAGGLPFQLRFDYGYDGVMRSFEDSLHRLGLPRVDLLVIHDVDPGYHEDDAGVERCFAQLDGGGIRALEELKSAGDIKGFGAGINEGPMLGRFLDRFDLDFFLVAMPYTLLDQAPLDETLPRCVERGIGIVIGSPYASGILATGPIQEAKYNYAPAAPEILDKAGKIQAVCKRHGIALAAAALQFPLGHPAVAAVIPGAVAPGEVERNVATLQVEVPAELWAELKQERLLHPDAPVPS